MADNQYDIGRAIFEEIRDMPYRVSEFIDDTAPNCVFKSTLLLHRLGTIGMAVRGRVAEMDWHDTLLPKEIIALYPSDIPTTHFYVEIEDKNGWRALDAGWDMGLEKAGFPIASFDGKNSPGFPLRRVYGLDEQARYYQLRNSPGHREHYFTQAARFLKAANEWFAAIRA